MKRTGRLLLILFALAVSGCAMHITLPDKEMSVPAANLPSQKIPLKAGILLPAEDFTLTRTWINPALESNTLTETVPFGKLMRRSARQIFPALFEQAVILAGKPYPPGLDIICVPTVTDFTFGVDNAGGFSQPFTVKIVLRSRITDDAGGALFYDELSAETHQTFDMGFSEQAYYDNWATIMAMAVNNAFLKAARSLAASEEIQAYARNKSGGAFPRSLPETPGPVPGAQPSPPSAESLQVREKLKDALEEGAISAEQLSRALEESRRTPRSRILDAFLAGKIDAKKFGELY